MVTLHLLRTPAGALNLIQQEAHLWIVSLLRNCLAQKYTRVSPSHFNSAIHAIRCIGRGDEAFSRMCFTRDPPETGKTTTIITLLWAIIHHSFHRHVGRPQNQSISSEGEMIECVPESIPLHVLFVAAFNTSADKIMWQLHADVI